MKKLFNVTIGGYYLCSVVLGIMMALTIGMTACDTWDYMYSQCLAAKRSVKREYPDGGFTKDYRWIDLDTHDVNYDVGVFYLKGNEETEVAWTALKRQYDRIWRIEHYVPLVDLWDAMDIYYDYGDGYSIQYGEFYLIAVAGITLVLSVLIMEGKSANKVWRQKMLQALGIAMFIVLVDAARRCAWYRVYSMTSASPVALLLPVAFLVIPLIILKKTRQPKKAKAEVEIVNPDIHKEIVVPPGASNEAL